MTGTPVLDVMPATSRHPAVTYRQAGDGQVLIEFGEMELDLRHNFHVQAVLRELDRHPLPGLIEAAPGFRSLMVTFQPDRIGRSQVIADVSERIEAAVGLAALRIPSRLITLPIAFDDEMSREAVHRYRITTRSDAPNVSPGDNIDYLVRCNGFAHREAFYETFLRATWWNAFVGYFPGLPSLFSMDPLSQISVPKYNPARMWTPEGSVAIGGPCVVIYPVEAPGSYQLFGRTLPILDPWRRADVFADDPILFRVADRVRFERVTEPELLALRRQALEGTYRYQVETAEFDVAGYLAECQHLADRASLVRELRSTAAGTVDVP
ncbi:5-oxoprolinase subunit B family protein [Trujillonella humicola]|uniref:5-oxoprolinase subunit B family protein n=1 Tax=Trujillonella humicola TaxID=3383699 RepID=UPI003905CF48